MAATEILLCLLFLYPTFREVQESITEEKSHLLLLEIACWFESYAQNTVSFEKLEQELGNEFFLMNHHYYSFHTGWSSDLENYFWMCQGIFPEYFDRQRRKLYFDYCRKQTV